MAAKPKDEKTTFITNTQRLSKTLQTQITQLSKVVEGINSLPNTVVPLAEQIEDKQIELNALAEQVETKTRENAAELALRIKENREKVLKELLNEFGLAEIAKIDLAEINKELVAANSNLEETVNQAVAKAKQSHAIEIAAIKRSAEQELALATAQKDAKIENQADRIEYLASELEKARTQLNKVIDSHTEQEKYRSQATGTVVNTGNGR